MASTNKTTNYELSQYIGTDKPTYLTDYNQDMEKIDIGIHAAKSEADTNSSAIGTLSNLNTETKTDIVSAINEVVSDVATNTGNIATNTSNISTNTTHIGTLANLTTSAKTDLVQASNEINAKVGNIANLNTTEKSSTVGAINEVNNKVNRLEPELLYNGNDDGTSNITLSSSAANYKTLIFEIFVDATQIYLTQEIYDPDGKSMSLMAFQSTPNACRLFNRGLSISGTTITTTVHRWVYLNSLSPQNSTDIKIIKIYGIID